MAIASNVYTGPYTGNGTQTAFAFDFTAVSASDVSVQVNGATISSNLYVVSISDAGTGTVTFSVPPASGASVLLLLTPDFAQETVYENEGAYKLSTVNATNRRAAIRANYLNAVSKRTFLVPVGETAPAVASLAGSNDGKALGFVDGQIVPVANSAAEASNEAAIATAQAVIAATQATNAAASATNAATSATNSAASATSASNSAATATTQAGAVAAALNSASAPYATAYASTLPKGVTSVTIGGTAITGATVGEYPITGSGGSIAGYSLTLVVTSATTATVRVDEKGLGTGTTPPTLTKPAGATLPVGTTLTAVVGTIIPDQRTYYVVNADSTKVLLYGNNGGSVATAPFGGTQLAMPSAATVDARLAFFSVPGGEYALTFGKPTGPIYAGITDAAGLWDFSGVRTLPIYSTDGTLTASLSGDTTRSGFLLACYDSVTRALLLGLGTDGTLYANVDVPEVTAARGTAVDLNTRISRGLTTAGSPKTAMQNVGRLANYRSGLSYLKLSGSALVHVILDGDSWWDSKNYGSTDALTRFYADSGLANAGPGWIGFSSALTGGNPRGTALNNITVSRTGTWTDQFRSADVTPGTIQNFPGYDAALCGANGSIYTITSSQLTSATYLRLFCGKGSGIEYSWDGTTYASLTITAGSGSTYVDVPLTGQTNSLRLRCASGALVSGLFCLTASSGVVFSNFGNSGSTAVQKASVQSNADYKAMMAALPGDTVLALIQLGLNDTKAGTANATIVTNVGTVAAGYRTIYTGYPTCDVAILCQPNTPLSVQDALSPLLRVWAEDNNAAFLDWQTYFGTPATSGDYASYSRDYTSGAASTALPLLEVSTSYRHPSPTSALIAASKSAVVTGAGVVASTLSNLLLSPLRSN